MVYKSTVDSVKLYGTETWTIDIVRTSEEITISEDRLVESDQEVEDKVRNNAIRHIWKQRIQLWK